jgi:putative phosphoribosyl transferase
MLDRVLSPEHAITALGLPLPAQRVRLLGDLSIPPHATGLIIVPRVQGCTPHSPGSWSETLRHRLHTAGFGTLCVDLRTETEARDDRLAHTARFDIPRHVARLVSLTDWLSEQRLVASLPFGYLAAGTEAAVTLMAASERPTLVRAIVTHAGRADLAGLSLPLVRAATMLLAGADDMERVAVNQQAYRALRCTAELALVPDTVSLFADENVLSHVARLSALWFAQHLSALETRAEVAKAGQVRAKGVEHVRGATIAPAAPSAPP